MKKIFSYFKDFHKDYYSTKLYLYILVFIGILITLNYKYDLKHSFIDSFTTPWRMSLLFISHGIAYYGVLLIIHLFDKSRINFSREFWLKSSVAFLLIAIDRTIFPIISAPVLNLVAPQTYRFFYVILNNAYGWLTVVAVLALVKFFWDKKETYGLYGLKFKEVDWRPYFILLLLVIPIIYAASHLQQFINFYPLYKKSQGLQFANYYKLPEYVAQIIYEFFYVSDFLSTELMFRGFLVIGMAKLMGKNVILPMAVTYAILHFGKPIGETISSVFGGYILGVIALYSRNIWGGVFIHGGTAFVMEVFAFLKQ